MNSWWLLITKISKKKISKKKRLFQNQKQQGETTAFVKGQLKGETEEYLKSRGWYIYRNKTALIVEKEVQNCCKRSNSWKSSNAENKITTKSTINSNFRKNKREMAKNDRYKEKLQDEVSPHQKNAEITTKNIIQIIIFITGKTVIKKKLRKKQSTNRNTPFRML